MKYGLATTLAVVVLAAAAAGFGFGWARGSGSAGAGVSATAWMQHEFGLSDARMAEVLRLHAAYQEICDAHCRVILEQRAEVVRLRSEGAAADVQAAAERRLAAIDARCRADLRAHVEAVAEAMGGSAGERYLAIILPRIAEFDHSGAPDLRLEAHHAHDHAGPSG